ncbi:hypothetical protein QBC46DRAFT_442435, partial [Diplogelasinospora grovesii]
EAKLTALSTLRQWIQANVSATCRAWIEDCNTVADELRELRFRAAPTDYAETQAVTRDYRQIQMISKSTKVEDWLDQWDKVLRNAQRLNLPDVAGDRPVRDFLEAVRPYNPLFTQTWSNTLDMAQLTAQPFDIDGFGIAQIFRSQLRQIRTVKEVSRATFAVFQGQSLRPKGWTPNPAITAKMHKIEENDSRIKRKFKRIREQASTPSTPAPKEPTVPREPALPSSAFASFASATEPSHHPLRNSVIYDSGSDHHLGNDISRFDSNTIRWLDTPDHLIAGDSQLPILAYGDLVINTTTATGEARPFILRNAAYVPDFHVSVASARLFKRAQIY